MAAVLPESMDKLDPRDTSGSLRTMEQYIRYMAERIDFAVRGMNRNISSAGVSSLVLYNALVELSGSLSSMRGTLNQLSGSVTETQEQVAGLSTSVTALQEAVTALGDRVTALENQNGG